MNKNRMTPDEGETDRLLESRMTGTTPEFEARWIDLKRELRLNKHLHRRLFAWRGAWIGAVLGGAAAAVVLLFRSHVQPPPPSFSPTFVELYEMNDVLNRALPLVDAENRDELLNLPAKTAPQT